MSLIVLLVFLYSYTGHLFVSSLVCGMSFVS